MGIEITQKPGFFKKPGFRSTGGNAMKVLIAIPVYNEEKYLTQVLSEVRRYGDDILVVNDGSTDRTTELLAKQHDLHHIIHRRNRGYGAAILSAMGYAI